MSKFTDKQDNSGACWFCGQSISDLACGNCEWCENGKRKDRRMKMPETDKEKIDRLENLIDSMEAHGSHLEAENAELEQQLSTLRRLAKDKLDTENDCWAAGTDSVLFAAQTRNVKAYEALKAALEVGDGIRS